MCGIVGSVGVTNIDLFKDALQELKLRGPNFEGLKQISEDVFFGHRRLAIIDLKESANQPMGTKEEGLDIVFNGEIYNYKELKKELINKYQFYSDSDTEVILKCFREFGFKETINKLDGMFTFAIYDYNTKRIYIANDELGKKPLYYSQLENNFLFSSSIDSILKISEKPLISTEAVKLFLDKGFIPAPYSIYENIHKLNQASYLIYDVESRKIIEKATYHEVKNNPEKLNISENEWVDKIDNLLIAAVEKRLISDVPIGALLSGGIDSSLISAIAKKELGYDLNTFTMRFSSGKYNEADIAKDFAKYLGTNHYEESFDLENFESFDYILDSFGQPFADNSAIPTYHICKLASGFNKVILTGDGGDEAFGGYKHYYAAIWAEKLKYLIPKGLGGLVEKNKYIPNQIKWLLLLNNRSGGNYFYDLLGDKGFAYREDLMNNKINFNSHFQENQIWNSNTGNYVDKCRVVDYNYLLPNDFLVKTDVLSMLSSVEARSPFLDMELIDSSFKLPLNLLINKKQPKFLLRKLASRYLPQSMINLPKRGFSFPLEDWIEKHRSKVLQIIIDEKHIISKYLNVSSLIVEIDKSLNSRQIWNVYVLARWIAQNKHKFSY